MSDHNQVLQENIRIFAQVIGEMCQASTRRQVSPHPLTRNQLYLLRILSVSGEFLCGELAVILDISPAAASKNIDRLEQWGLVRRHTRSADRRSHTVRLTEAGQSVVDAFARIITQKMSGLMAQFSEEEKDLFLGLLRRTVRFILSERQNTDVICLQCGGACGDTCAVGDRVGRCSLARREVSNEVCVPSVGTED